MNESRTIAECIQILAGTFNKKDSVIITGDVTSIDEDNRLCEVESVLDSGTITYPEVHLSPERNDGIIEIPAIGSTVIMVKMPDNEVYVLKCSDIDRIVGFIDTGNKFEFDAAGWSWNDGNFGGLVKIDNLKTQWDANMSAIKTAVSAALAVIDTQLLALGQPGGSAAAFNSSASSILNLNKTTLEDNKVNH